MPITVYGNTDPQAVIVVNSIGISSSSTSYSKCKLSPVDFSGRSSFSIKEVNHLKVLQQ